jgi:uncharacterized protein YjiS (DUF1127 family)
MSNINRQTKRIATWLIRLTARNDLTTLSNQALQDIGLVRYQPSIEACKPFWMA